MNFLLRLMQGPAPSVAQRVEPVFRLPDPWQEQIHAGSPDLEQYPPSLVELELAKGALEGWLEDVEDLVRVAQSEARFHAVLQRARVLKAAEQVLERVRGER